MIGVWGKSKAKQGISPSEPLQLKKFSMIQLKLLIIELKQKFDAFIILRMYMI
jgi:hypothetical protein